MWLTDRFAIWLTCLARTVTLLIYFHISACVPTVLFLSHVSLVLPALLSSPLLSPFSSPSRASPPLLRLGLRHTLRSDIMKNGAHASDSEASLARERAIIGLVPGAPSMTRRTIEAWLEMQEGKAPRGGSSGGVRLSSHVANPKDQQYAYDEVAQHSYYY